jgi:signal transduction histidine kinase
VPRSAVRGSRNVTHLHSDPDLITLVLQNVVGNAIKYSTSGTVQVTGERVNDQWVLSVSDEGPGIEAEHLGRIFEAFTRGESHGQPGVGLGLTIAARAAALLNAKLTVESTLGTGSIFRLEMPSEAPKEKT